tara:strand:- start:244 stop:717 length:474 start_codon:yes stop_codon:yes gene_type:complete
MSNFWDGLIFPSKVNVVAVEQSDFWASIGLGGELVRPLPVKQSKVKAVKKTAKQSKAVVQAERVYETIEGLVVPAKDCIHSWVIPSETAWAIGVCKTCNGEKWFSNRYIEQSTFNDTLIPPKIEQEINDVLNMDDEAMDINTLIFKYTTEQSGEESE